MCYILHSSEVMGLHQTLVQTVPYLLDLDTLHVITFPMTRYSYPIFSAIFPEPVKMNVATCETNRTHAA